MNKDKLLKFLDKTDFALSKEQIDLNIFLGLCANVGLYFLFKNIVVNIVLAIFFIIFTAVMLRNRWYLREHYNSVLVKTWLTGFWFITLSVGHILFQIRFKISVWLFVVELVILIVNIIILKRHNTKLFEKEKYDADIKGLTSAPKKGGSIFITVHIISSILMPHFIENIAWYFLSVLLFIFILFAETLFVSMLIIYIGYIKYVDE